MLSVKFDYLSFDQKEKTIVEYIWIGGLGYDLRSKSKVINGPVITLSDVPTWNYDGSSCGQSTTDKSEIELIPVALFDDPFRGAPNKLVLCESQLADGSPTASNFRRTATKVFTQENCEVHDPWFGIEQEYILTQRIGSHIDWPIGWGQGQFPGPQYFYYCGTGSKYVYGREISDAHLKTCLAAGIQIYGTNAEVFPGQWEFQIGTSKGIDCADHLWVARWLLIRVAEKFNVDVTFEPKPFEKWNGSGAHTNYSNKASREDQNLENTTQQFAELEKYHSTFIKLYGEGNEKRLSGNYETSSIDKFSYGVMNRAASIRIPEITQKNGNGYYEDRRPAANVNPYICTSLIFSATCLNGEFISEFEERYNNFLKAKSSVEH